MSSKCFVREGERIIMKDLGEYKGEIKIMDRDFRGMFKEEKMREYMMGKGKV